MHHFITGPWIRFLSFMLGLFLCASCATTLLWDTVDPAEYVVISKTPASLEYIERHRLKFYEDDERAVYFVEKNRLEKFRDYTVRTLATPITFAADAATTIVVVGAGVWLIAHGWGPVSDEPGWNSQSKEQEQLQQVLEEMRREKM